ncbi:MAG: hypothetical protein K8L91_13495 [Anaerolineae bacterium]|nr:hypothetical protein [Anaerolineae bacterium]
MITAYDRNPYYAEFIEFVTSRPTLEEMANYRLSETSEARLSALLEANRNGTLTIEAQTELDDYSRLEHLLRMLKYSALEKLTR